MTPEQVKAHFQAPTVTALAATLGRPISTVAEWFQNDRIPRAVQLELQIDTNGALLAEPRKGATNGESGQAAA
jgi:hypothetical protein